MSALFLPRSPLLRQVVQSWSRDNELPFAHRARKGLAYLVHLASARIFLRACDRVGLRARTQGRPLIKNQGRIEIGDDLNLISTFVPAELVAGPRGHLEIGHRVLINFGTVVAAQNHVRIGSNVLIGPYSIVADTEMPGLDLGSLLEARPVVIHDDVWLAGRVTVLPGVTIGPGSVIAAGSIVDDDIPAGVVAGGVPARVIRRL